MLAYENEALATETETKAFSVETEAKTKTYSLEAEARPRRLKFQPRQDRAEALYCASRRPRDRGVKTEATSLQIILAAPMLGALAASVLCRYDQL